MADNDALTRKPRTKCEVALGIATDALIDAHAISEDALVRRRIIVALDRISTLRKEAGE